MGAKIYTADLNFLIGNLKRSRLPCTSQDEDVGRIHRTTSSCSQQTYSLNLPTSPPVWYSNSVSLRQALSRAVGNISKENPAERLRYRDWEKYYEQVHIDHTCIRQTGI